MDVTLDNGSWVDYFWGMRPHLRWALAACLTACGARPADLLGATQRTLDGGPPPVCLRERAYLSVTTRADLDGPAGAGVRALTRHGLLNVVDEGDGRLKVVGAPKWVALTLNKNDLNPIICGGRVKVQAATPDGDPFSQNGLQWQRVHYTYTVEEVPDWATDPEVVRTHPGGLPDPASYTGNTLRGQALVRLN